MQVMRYCDLPFEFAGDPNFELLCDEEMGASLCFTARFDVNGNWKFQRSSFNLNSGMIKFFTGELDGYKVLENFLNVQIDHETVLNLDALENQLEIDNLTDIEINTSEKVNSYSLAKVFNSEWINEINSRFNRYHSLKGYKDQRKVEREHLILFSSECFVEFITTDPWQVNIGLEDSSNST